jgi:hypothetical protein
MRGSEVTKRLRVHKVQMPLPGHCMSADALLGNYGATNRAPFPNTPIALSSPAPTLTSWVRIPLEAWMFVCVLCAVILCLPRVEAGKNTSTVIPASRKRRQKGNPVVSG